MLAKNKNSKVSYVSRLLALPLAAIIFFAFTLKVKTAAEANPENKLNKNILKNSELFAPVLQKDTIPPIYYNNKKLSVVKYLDPSNNIQATYADGSKETMTKEEALKRGFIPPPPPGIPPYYFKTNMLFVANGDIITKEQAENIDQNEIDKIFVLKGDKAVAKYGYKAKEGVIEFITKQGANDIKIIADSIYFTYKGKDKIDNNISTKSKFTYVDLKGSSNPLIITDGKEINKEGMKSIPRENIEGISILKSSNGKALYGEKGKNGVIVITTKRFSSTRVSDTIPDKVFEKVEEEASFPGGPNAWRDYITKKITGSMDSLTKEDFGTCVIKFIVNTDGSVSNAVATNMKGTRLAQLAINAISNGPKWIPAKQNGKAVAAYRLQPVTLAAPGEKKLISGSNNDLPLISISGSNGGRISLSKMEGAKGLEINSDKYSIAGFTIYFSGANYPHVKSYSQEGAKFSTELQKEWKNIKPGTAVSLDNVKFRDTNGSIVTAERAPGFIVYK